MRACPDTRAGGTSRSRRYRRRATWTPRAKSTNEALASAAGTCEREQPQGPQPDHARPGRPGALGHSGPGAPDFPLSKGGGGGTGGPIQILLREHRPAESLLVTEVLTPGGNWWSYPPHKHDTDDLPRESLLEETYYHRTRRPEGFAMQLVY